MAQDINLKVLGLYSHPNKFSEAPPGSLLTADNVVIDRESIAQTRRGHKQYGDQLTLTGSPPGSPIDRIFEYKEKLVIHYDDTKLAYDSDGAGTWTDYTGSFAHPDTNYKMRAAESNKNLYFTTSGGVYKLDSLTATPILSGAYKALGGTGAVTGASGFMTTNTAVAYRLVWAYYDANNNLILGTPSQRVIVANSSGGTRDVSLTFDIPDGVTTDWLFQIYRSNESASATTTPDDELQLVYEDNPTSAQITAQQLTITDSTQNDLKGASLYTNQSQQTILQTNDQPPYCKDMTIFKNHMFYANTKTKHRYRLDLIAVGSPDGVQINDTITIAGTTYTGKAAENAAADEFLVDTSGTPSQNIDATAISLVRVINQSSTNTSVYAYYLSGYEDIPGYILIEERAIGGASFALTSSRSTCWNPRLPSSGTTESSDNEESPHRVYISKIQQPEAVPLVNYIDIGSADQPIKRIIALRDSVMVLKDDGIFRITGTTLPFSVYPFNDSVKLKGRESAVVLDNRIYAMTDQGVVAIHDSGVEIVSRPIETDLIALLGDQYTNFEDATFGVGYESDRRYCLFTVSATTDTYATQAWTYNTITQSWTRWTTPRSCGYVKNSDDKMYMGHPTNDYVYQERKTRTSSDYADEEYAVTITGSSGTTVSLVSTTNVVAGMTLKQDLLDSIVVSVDSATDITVEDVYTWDAAAATVNTPINCTIEWVPEHAGNPGIQKHWREMSFIFDDAAFNEITTTVSSNFVGEKSITLSSIIAGSAWGEFAWGGSAWGGALGGSAIIRTLFPRDTQRSHWVGIKLNLNEAFTSFSVAGVSVFFNPVGPKMR